MYKYKDTKDAYTHDLVMWTDLPEGFSNRIPYKVYLVKRKDGNLVEILDENNKLQFYGKLHGFKVLKTKSASQAKVGDYIFRLSEGPEEFPKGEIRKVISRNSIFLSYKDGFEVGPNEVIAIEPEEEENKQEKEKSYPYFLQGIHNAHPMIVRQDKDSYKYLHIKSEALGKTFEGKRHDRLVPCDFTIEPEIYDLDWYQQRFKAGLPVYAVMPNGCTSLCKGLSPKEWNTATRLTITDNQSSTTNKIGAQQEPASKTLDIDNPSTIEEWDARFKAGLPVWYILDVTPIQATKLPSSYIFGDIFFTGPMKYVSSGNYFIPWEEVTSCQDSIKANQQTQPTIKEQTMKLQQLLDAIFGVSDYEAKPKFIVTVFNNDKEVGTTTAESIEEIQQTIQSDTRLWGCKLVAYKIHSELQTQVPVAITKFKKESNASAE